MAARCTNCGKKISTLQELTTAGSEVIKAIWQEIKKIDWTKIIGKMTSSVGTMGAVAGPLNSQEAPCPHCGAKGRWVDE